MTSTPPPGDDRPEPPVSPLAPRLTLALPFYAAILWGVIIATLSLPLYARLLPRLKQRRNLTAALVMLVVLVVGVLPLALLSASLANEATQAYAQIKSGAWDPGVYIRGLFDALPAWMAALFSRFGLVDFDTLQARLIAAAAQDTQVIAAQALAIGLDTFDFVTSLFIALYLAFFLVRDGAGLARTAWSAIPLAAAHKRVLIAKFVAVVRATVKGSLLVAAIQGGGSARAAGPGWCSTRARRHRRRAQGAGLAGWGARRRAGCVPASRRAGRRCRRSPLRSRSWAWRRTAPIPVVVPR